MRYIDQLNVKYILVVCYILKLLYSIYFNNDK